MQLPAEAGALLVDTRPGMRMSFQLVLAGMMLAIVLAMPLFDRKLLPITGFVIAASALVGGLFALVQMFVRRVFALCEGGLVIRHRRAWHVVPWAAVRGLREDWFTYQGKRTRQLVIETSDRRFALTPRHLGFANYNERSDRAIAVIEQRANLKLTR